MQVLSWFSLPRAFVRELGKESITLGKVQMIYGRESHLGYETDF